MGRGARWGSDGGELQYRREIDGLRAVAVLPVIFWHAGFEAISGGFIGVDIFFVISGFLIATILYEEVSTGRYSILRFYERRARRILPALFLVMAASIPFAWAWMQPEALIGFSESIAAATFFVSNIYFWLTSSYFAIVNEQLPLLHTWSLAVEEQFYLVFPLLLWALWKLSPRHLMSALILLALISLAYSEWRWRGASEANFYLAPSRAWELLAGAAAGIHCHRHGVGSGNAWLNQTLSALGLAMMLLSFFVYDRFTPFPSLYALLPVIGAVLTLVFARTGTYTASFLSARPMVGIGMISYSAYLWHQPIFAFARIRLLYPPPSALMLALIVLSLALAALSWRYVERPFRQRRDHAAISTTRLWQFVATGALAFAALSAIGPLTNGARFRFSPEVNALTDQFATVFDERIKVARVGYCELNTKIVPIEADAFEKSWACKPLPGGPLADSHVAIFGDSHSSDIAMAMRLNGQDVTHVAGAGCAVSPDLMLGKCRRLADFLKEQIALGGITDLWLVERYETRELRPKDIQSLIDYWQIPGVKVSVFAPMPEFPEMKDWLIKSVWLGRHDALPRDHVVEQAFNAPQVKGTLANAGFRIIDTASIFCAAMPNCEPVDGTTLLMTDGQHLTTEGARRFGTHMLKTLHR
jgi:peptidoglycan/LPS O-acetylase OafA/YrhL